MGVLLNSPLTKRGKGVEVVKAAGVARAMGSTSDSNRSACSNGGRKKKDGFSSKIHIPSSVARRVTPVM